MRQIWNSELYSRNKALGHNIFAISVLTAMFSILEWTKQELEHLDTKTRKILIVCASFHINSNIDSLYCYPKYGRRGLNSISDRFVTRIVTVTLHLKYPLLENKFLQHVVSHESEGLIRVPENLMENFDINTNNFDHHAKTTNLSLKCKIKRNHLEKLVNKNQHGYLNRSRKRMQDIDNQNTKIWLKNVPFFHILKNLYLQSKKKKYI